MRARLQGKRTVITGAGNGIGRATALAFAREGARLLLADIDEDAVSVTTSDAAAAGVDVHAATADVSRSDDVADLFEAARDRLGGLDVILNIAGVLRAGNAVDISDEDWERVFDVNLRSCLLTARHGVPLLREAGGGSIVCTGSVAGIIGVPGAAAYAAAKAAVVMFAKSLAKELVADGIRVNAVCPGWVDTPFNDPIVAVMGGRAVQDQAVESAVPMKRQGWPEEIAPAYVYLASDEAAYVTAKAMVVDGGAT
jgi:dihydroanticapsin dehydrogenase